MSFLSELRRRNVFRVGIGYVITAWLLLQVVDVVVPILAVPDWVSRVVLILLVVGFFPALIFAWAFELTPEGVKREKDVDSSQSITGETGHKLDRAIIVVLAVALAWFAWDKFRSSETDKVTVNAETSSQPAAVSGPTVKSIAVLPFANMSADPEQEYFSDGLAEELLNRLVKNDGLQVAARTSSFQFKGQHLDVAEIGRQLKVDNVLEGSVRKSGNRLRVTAQLISAADGYHLWSETYEREINDIFAIQDDISGAISRALEVELGMAQLQAQVKPEHDIDAYNRYLQARYFLAKRGGPNMFRALELFQQAVELDPTMTDAWSGLAFTYALLPNYDVETPSSKAIAAGKQAVERALALDPNNTEALTARARMRAALEWQWQEAQKDFEKALAIEPNNIQTVNLYGDFLTATGDFDRAEQLERRAIELDPLSAVHAGDLAQHLTTTNRFSEALEYAKLAASLAPDEAFRQDAIMIATAFLGDFEAARRIIETTDMSSIDTGFSEYWWIVFHYSRGDEAALRDAVENLKALSEDAEMVFWPSYIGFFSMWLDGPQAALPWLEAAYEQHDPGLAWPEIFYLPMELSDDPEWLAFWQRPGLAELIEMRRSNGPYENISFWREKGQ